MRYQVLVAPCPHTSDGQLWRLLCRMRTSFVCFAVHSGCQKTQNKTVVLLVVFVVDVAVVVIRVWLIPAAKTAEAAAAACADGDQSSKQRKWEKNIKAHKSVRKEYGERSVRAKRKYQTRARLNTKRCESACVSVSE